MRIHACASMRNLEFVPFRLRSNAHQCALEANSRIRIPDVNSGIRFDSETSKTLKTHCNLCCPKWHMWKTIRCRHEERHCRGIGNKGRRNTRMKKVGKIRRNQAQEIKARLSSYRRRRNKIVYKFIALLLSHLTINS